MTNFDRIMKMTVEEMGVKLSDILPGCPPSATSSGECGTTDGECENCWIEWLNEDNNV